MSAGGRIRVEPLDGGGVVLEVLPKGEEGVRVELPRRAARELLRRLVRVVARRSVALVLEAMLRDEVLR